MAEDFSVEGTQPDPGFDAERIRGGEAQTYDSSDSQSMDRALEEVHRRRQEQQLPRVVQDAVDTIQTGAPPPEPKDVITLKYIDGKDRRAGISAEEASRDYNSYKQQLAGEYLREVITQAQASEAEAQQPAEQPAEPVPDAAEVERQIYAQQRQAEIQNLVQAQQRYGLALQSVVDDLQGIRASEFPDIRDEADAARLAQSNPQRFARLQQYVQAHHSARQHIDYLQQQQTQLYQAQYKPWAQQQDQIAERMIPELANDETRESLQRATLAELKDAGFREDELYAAWNGQQFHLRDARVQKVISDAARWRLAQQRGQDLNSHRKQPPPVQRPGTAGLAKSGHDIAVERLSAKLAKGGSINDAYELVLARRAASQGD